MAFIAYRISVTNDNKKSHLLTHKIVQLAVLKEG